MEHRQSSYLEVDETEPPLGRVLVGVVRHQQSILKAADRLAVEGIFHRRVDATPPNERRRHAVSLQLHGVHTGPVPCRYGVKPLTHGKTGKPNKNIQHFSS